MSRSSAVMLACLCACAGPSPAGHPSTSGHERATLGPSLGPATADVGEVQDASVRRAAATPRSATVPAALADESSPVVKNDGGAALPPALPKGTTVLHVGDSMADALGKPLALALKKRGIKSILEAKEATYIPDWAGHKMQLEQQLAGHKPDLVIITLGGNETRMPDPSERVVAIKKLVEKIGDRPCLWVAAPLWPGLKHTGILDVIRDNCAPCRYVDTNVLIPDLERLGDGVHPTIPERRRWAAFMIRWLLTNRDPEAARPWQLKAELAPPPPGSEAWLEQR